MGTRSHHQWLSWKSKPGLFAQPHRLPGMQREHEQDSVLSGCSLSVTHLCCGLSHGVTQGLARDPSQGDGGEDEGGRSLSLFPLWSPERAALSASGQLVTAQVGGGVGLG